MIQADHTWAGKAVCEFCSGVMLNRAFRDIRFIPSGEPLTDGPVLVVANHFSWWDGFIQYRLNREKWHRRFHVMMLEEQLKRNRILQHAGAFSVRKHSREVIGSLEYCAGLLQDNKNLVLLFPQGEIQSLYTTDFYFEKGLGYLLRHAATDFQLVFNVNLVDYFSHRKPSLSVYWKNDGGAAGRELKEVEAGFNSFYRACILKQKEG